MIKLKSKYIFSVCVLILAVVASMYLGIFNFLHLNVFLKPSVSNINYQYSCDDKKSFEKFIDMNVNSYSANGLDFKLQTYERNTYDGNDYSIYIVSCGKSDSEVHQTETVLAKENDKYIPDIWFSDSLVSLDSHKYYSTNKMIEVYGFELSNMGNCFNCTYKEYIARTDKGLVWLTRGFNSTEDRKTVSGLITDNTNQKLYLEMSEGWDSMFGLAHALGVVKNYLYLWNDNLEAFETTPTIYPEYFQQQINKSQDFFDNNCLTNNDESFSADPCLSNSVVELLNYESMGNRIEGWKIFQRKMKNIEKITTDQLEKSHIQEAMNVFGSQIKNNSPLQPNDPQLKSFGIY